MKNQKKIAKNGSLTLPQTMRHELGIFAGTPVDIETTEDGALTIRKHRPTCHICGSVNHVVEINGLGICHRCHCKFVDEFEVMEV